ncbi:MAG: hypothetical protein GY698_04625 [Actinomycetia bacterium]|nr:hypothetical protein [Actinomycetes bacterium]
MARTHKLAEPARTRLQEVNIGINDPRTGALIGRTGHQGLHDHAEIVRVSDGVVRRRTEATVAAVLLKFKEEYELRFPCGARP